MVTPSLPSEFADDSMVLMAVLYPMREDDIRVHAPPQIRSEVLRSVKISLDAPIDEFPEHELHTCGTFEQLLSTPSGLVGAIARSRKDHPLYFNTLELFEPAQQSASAADFDVIAVSA